MGVARGLVRTRKHHGDYWKIVVEHYFRSEFCRRRVTQGMSERSLAFVSRQCETAMITVTDWKNDCE